MMSASMQVTLYFIERCLKTYVRVHDFGLEVLCGELDDLVGRGVESCDDGLGEEECSQGNGGEALLHVEEEEGCDER